MRFLKSSRGQVVIAALVFAGIMLTSSVGLFNYSTQYVRFERRSVADAQALQLAEAAIDKAVYQLNQSSSYTGENATPLGGGTFNIAVTSIDSSTKRITATAYVPNSTRPSGSRTIKATVNTGGTSAAFHYGVQAGEGGFTMNGGSTINGSLYANGNVLATNGVHITGSVDAANPAATTTDQANDQPSSISSCNSTTCITFGDANSTQDFAQSFQISNAEPLNYLEFYIKKVGAPSDETVRIVNDSSGSPGTDVLMTGTLSAASVTTSFGWVKVTMPTTPVLDTGQTYWIVIDGSSNASKYYVIGANTTYTNGAAMIGKYSTSWSATAGLDGYFRLYTGGGYSYIGGDTYAGGLVAGTTGSDEVWAHTVKGVTASGNIYCTSISVSNKGCTAGRADPPSTSLPLSDNVIQDWKDEAAAGTLYTGNVTVGYAGATIGPEKIIGNLTVNGGGTLTQTGTIWVTGSITVTGGGKIKLDSAYGANSGVIVADGTVTINGGASFSGSGTTGSYPFVVTTSACPVEPGCNGSYAIDESGGAGAVALVAQSGTVNLAGGSAMKAVTGRQINMTGGATLTYDSGLINTNFYSGPGGSWQVEQGSYAITQ